MQTHQPWRSALVVAAFVCLFSSEAFVMAAPSATAPGGVLARVPIEFTRNQVRVPVSINGSAPFRLILDTGMPGPGVLLRHSDRVDSLALEFPGSDQLSGGGSGPAVQARVAPSERITVGGIEISEVPVAVLPPQSALLQEVDGVIGAELFDRYAVRVDVDHKTMDLLDAKTFEPNPGSSIVALRIRDRMAFVDARVTVDGGAPVTADLAIDLGAGHGLWLNDDDDGRFAPPAHTIETVLGRGLSGPITGSVGRVRRIEIGDFAFENVVTLFPVAEYHNPGGVDFRDGFIGAEILKRFVVTYDYEHKRMVLERGQRFSEAFEFDMSGMVLETGGTKGRRVQAVLANTPAEAAGVLPGDVLIAIDGKTILELRAEGVSDALKRDGVTVRVTLERDDATIEKTFTLRRLL